MNNVITMFFWLLVVAVYFKSAITTVDDSDKSLTSSNLTYGGM